MVDDVTNRESSERSGCWREVWTRWEEIGDGPVFIKESHDRTLDSNRVCSQYQEQ